MMPDIDAVTVVESVLKARRTEKVLVDVDSLAPLSEAAAAQTREAVLRSLRAAGWAPFHYPRNVSGIAEPWRAHVLWRDQACRLARYLQDDLGVTTKEPRLAAACSALVLVTWLPEVADSKAGEDPEPSSDKLVARNEEHLAAAAAMVQSMLLMLTAHGMGTYWSSGGVLRQPVAFDHLGIPRTERLLAAVFVEHPDAAHDNAERKPGSLRQSRSDNWIRELPG